MSGWPVEWKIAGALGACALALAGCGKPAGPATASGAAATSKDRVYTVAWTIYAGWMPWPYAQESGILKKWADKYGVRIRLVQVNDYVESLNQFSAGKVDGVTATTMDALTVPAAAGRDSTVVMIGDYSDGNDGVILKGSDRLADIKGRSVNLVENSVSHYLLARALESAGLGLPDVKTINTSDADIVAAFGAPQTTALVTWNPQLSEVKRQPGAHEVFDSSRIPGEILDTLIVDTGTLKANPGLGKALTGAWYETLALMSRDDAAGKAARTAMAKASGADLAGFDGQLKTTHLYVDPKAALAYETDPALVAATDRVRRFSFAHGLFGQGARSVDDIGISLPAGKTLGSAANVKLRFDPTWMALAADGKL
jgi:NitT/TauT family transport system substrate-binding protein